jgi:hypothetical protein
MSTDAKGAYQIALDDGGSSVRLAPDALPVAARKVADELMAAQTTSDFAESLSFALDDLNEWGGAPTPVIDSDLLRATLQRDDLVRSAEIAIRGFERVTKVSPTVPASEDEHDELDIVATLGSRNIPASVRVMLCDIFKAKAARFLLVRAEERGEVLPEWMAIETVLVLLQGTSQNAAFGIALIRAGV